MLAFFYTLSRPRCVHLYGAYRPVVPITGSDHFRPRGPETALEASGPWTVTLGLQNHITKVFTVEGNVVSSANTVVMSNKELCWEDPETHTAMLDRYKGSHSYVGPGMFHLLKRFETFLNVENKGHVPKRFTRYHS